MPVVKASSNVVLTALIACLVIGVIIIRNDLGYVTVAVLAVVASRWHHDRKYVCHRRPNVRIEHSSRND